MALKVGLYQGWLFFFTHEDFQLKRCLLAIDIDLASLLILINEKSNKKVSFILQRKLGDVQIES